MNQKNDNSTKKRIFSLGISAKTAVLTSAMVFVLLTVGSAFLFKFQTELVDSVIDASLKSAKRTIDRQAQKRRAAMEKQFQVTAKVYASLSGVFLYNVDRESPRVALGAFMGLPQVQAIEVHDAFGDPFVAVWKGEQGVETGNGLPKEFEAGDLISFQADSPYAGEKMGELRVYYSDAGLSQEQAASNALARKEMARFRQRTEQRMETAMVRQAIAIFIAVLILSAVIALILNIVAIIPLKRVIRGLQESAEHHHSTASQISAASQSLAEKSSEQAAYVEETSASVSSITEATEQNAQNTEQVNQLMKQTRQAAEEANRSMEALSSSMRAVMEASRQVSEIVKTIDGIAFQTNLLSLNAAVESARAGASGAGFAVVAEEVRRLATHSAEAAKNSNALIEDSVQKVKEGTEWVNSTYGAFEQVVSQVIQAETLINEVTSANRNQADSINEIHKAVNQVDELIRQTASEAETSAAASQAIYGQTEQLQGFVKSLFALVGGGSANAGIDNGQGSKALERIAIPEKETTHGDYPRESSANSPDA